MKRLLVFSFFPAFLPPASGGVRRLFHFYRNLSRDHHVTLLSSSHVGTKEEVVHHGSHFVERRIPKDHRFEEAWEHYKYFAGDGDLSAVCIAASAKYKTPLIDAYMEEYSRADVIIHDFPFTVDYDLFFGLDNKPRIYNSHNCETVLYRQLHPSSHSEPIWKLVEQCETRLVEGCDLLTYCSKSDLDAFSRMVPTCQAKSMFLPNGMSPVSPVAHREHAGQVITNALFMGSAHLPNLQAAQYIAGQIAPKLPNILFHILGECLVQDACASNVVRHGFVDERTKTNLVAQADLALNPITTGSGSNIKVFELMSYGIPVLSTPLGMRGIDAVPGESCLVAQLEDFPAVISSWSSKVEPLRRIGAAGRMLVESKYSWKKIASSFSTRLDRLCQEKTFEPYVLVLNDYDSFFNVGGGGVRTRGICRALSEWKPTVFLCFSDSEMIIRRQDGKGLTTLSVPKTASHTQDRQDMAEAFHISVDDILAISHSIQNALLVGIYDILRRNSIAIQVEHVYMATLPLTFNDRFVYSSHNVETDIKNDVLANHPKSETLISEVRNLEGRVIEKAAAVIAVSEEDAERFTQGAASAGPIIVVRNGSPVAAEPSDVLPDFPSKPPSRKYAVVFVGSAHMPNVEAAHFILKQLAPECPETIFHIVGTACTALRVELPDNVVCWGALSEEGKSAVMRLCDLAINPVVSGGGSNIKISDYLANGLYTVSTVFGARGYEDIIGHDCETCDLQHFSSTLRRVLPRIKQEPATAKNERKKVHSENFSMQALARQFVDIHRSLSENKKKVLFVTYRYTWPPLGGAESHLLHLIEGMDQADRFQIDVVAPEVTNISNLGRFSEAYTFDAQVKARTGLKNVRYARFPLSDPGGIEEKLYQAWEAQLRFEEEVFQSVKHKINVSGLAWGWGDAERNGEKRLCRWAFRHAGLYCHEDAVVRIIGDAHAPVHLIISDEFGCLLSEISLEGHFEFTIQARAGVLNLSGSCEKSSPGDFRPLMLYVESIEMNGLAVDLGKPLLFKSVRLSDKERFAALDRASRTTRHELNIELTDIRGPHSATLENYVQRHVGEYDLVITHNNIFRPAVVAVDAAKSSGVPVISLPHAHLDDDFYHFPDVHRSIMNSDKVLASPNLACEFYGAFGADVTHSPPGIDSSEQFTHADVDVFRTVWTVDKPFVLVLGRKSLAKGYMQVVSAVDELAKIRPLHLVMIGPDDDGVPIESRNVSYLGLQSREVVRGALLSCAALVNMSSSESFGIVLLEAWKAGKPVVVNERCAAFTELTDNGVNALHADDHHSLVEAICTLLDSSQLQARLAEGGRSVLAEFSWERIVQRFVYDCDQLIHKNKSSGLLRQGQGDGCIDLEQRTALNRCF